MLLLNVSCNTTEPTPANNGTLSISLTEVSCTEAWVNLKTNGVTFPVNVNFLADGGTVTQLNNLHSSDTTVYIDSLLPNKTYNIQAIIQSTYQYQTTSNNKVIVQTLDTTSNNFSFSTYSFGNPSAGGSRINDVAIIDENNIWVVGEIYMNDSTGQPDPEPYNLAIWNGTIWQLKKVTYNGHSTAIHSIFAIDIKNIWLDPWFHWNGKNFQEIPIDPILNGVSIKKIWGNSDIIYVAGANGFIAYSRSSGQWNKIESGTTTNILDIWGVNNVSDNSITIYCAVSNLLSQGDHKLLKINNDNTVTEKSWLSDLTAASVWFKNNNKMYVCGDFVVVNNIGDQWIQDSTLPSAVSLRIRGTDYNNVFVVGSYGLAAHFNGVNWNLLRPLNYGPEIYYSCDFKSGIMCAVGENNAQGWITIFR